MRLNPRQRWEEDGSSTIAGLSAPILTEFVSLAPNQIMKEIDRAPQEMAHYADDDRRYKSAMAEINGAIVQGLAEVVGEQNTGWVDLGPIRMRRGRGAEITIVAKNYSDLRSWLTNVSLALYDSNSRYKGYDEWSAHDRRLKIILDMLEKSSDRRPFNQYSYRDVSYAEIGKPGVRRRLESVKSERRVREWFEKEFPGPRMGSLGLLDWKVAQQIKDV